MKINWTVRFKNLYFLAGIFATIMLAIDVSPEMFTSWEIVWNTIVDLFMNPFKLGCAIIAVIAAINDPTTSGLNDSIKALTYKKPN